MRSVEDDEEAQKRGFVGCLYSVGGGFDFDLQLVRKTGDLRNALPVRLDAVHVCYNLLQLVPAFSLATMITRRHTRMRVRTHYGSDEECQCELSSFGIPIAALPVSPRGEFNLENHRAFVTTQRAIEVTKSRGKVSLGVAPKAKKKSEEKARYRQPIIKEDDVFVAASQPDLNETAGYGRLMSFRNLGFFLPQPSFASPWWSVVGAPNLPLGPTIASRPPEKLYKSPAKPYVIYDPLPHDILFGRGKPTQGRPGNVRFREMLDTHKDRYEEKKKGAKIAAAAYIVHLVKEEGGRFLKEFEDRGWVEVDEATARAKVNNAFRTGRRVRQATLKEDKRTA